MDAKITPEQAIDKLRKHDTLIGENSMGYQIYQSLSHQEAQEIAYLLESQTKYAEIGEAFIAHQKAVPCDFGYNDEDCRIGDCCDTIRRLCELSAEVD
ncbi:hypothetical protein [Sporomusa paucivorans]|uniref:hypothetical protein n=1 Tax=Sporomusa paucivorans TaxID=2376 RepID=UPI003570A2D6